MQCVKCRDCGYLAIRDPYSPDSAVSEAYDLVRDSGWQNGSNGKRTVARPFCYEKRRQFADPKTNQPNAIVAEINQEIECDAFTEWLPGRSPEKHKEMTLVEKLEQRTHQWREEDLALQRQLRDDADRYHRESLDWQERVEGNVHERHIVNLVMVLLVAIVGGIIALIGAKLLPWFH